MDEVQSMPFEHKGEAFDKKLVLLGELCARPFRRNSRNRIEILRFRQIKRGLIVIPKDNIRGEFTDPPDAVVGACSVSDNIAETDRFVDIFFVDEFESLVQAFDVGVDVRNNSDAHEDTNVENSG